jgi:hypothetical protein
MTAKRRATNRRWKQKVEAKYEITAIEWKKLFQKGLLSLLGTLILSNSAMGFTFRQQDLHKFEKGMQKMLQEQGEIGGNTYDFKIKAKNTGGAQNVEFDILKNGKVSGSVKFLGTDSNVVNKMSGGETKEAKNDEVVKMTVDHVAEIIKINMEKAKTGKHGFLPH